MYAVICLVGRVCVYERKSMQSLLVDFEHYQFVLTDLRPGDMGTNIVSRMEQAGGQASLAASPGCLIRTGPACLIEGTKVVIVLLYQLKHGMFEEGEPLLVR